jgi:iron complex outermembrane receptor protein
MTPLKALCLALAGAVAPAPAAANETYEFFDTEAKVVSAAKTPKSLRQAPATVYVVTAEQIKMSGAQTVWDALRGVPGMDVMATRSAHGEVSVRGINKPLNNRTLILVDGRTVLNALFQFASWDAIPIDMEEIDRIEVVEGPASALYGANALSGVINIITKRPDQLPKMTVKTGGGSHATRLAHVLAADSGENMDYKVGYSWRSTDSFERSGDPAGGAGKVNAFWGWRLPRGVASDLSAGFSRFSTRYGAGFASPVEEGKSGYYRWDVKSGKTHARFFSNFGRTTARDYQAIGNAPLRHVMYDGNLERTFSPSSRNSLIGGVGLRRTEAESPILDPDVVHKDLLSLFLEDDWQLRDRWGLVTSVRFDRDPLTRWRSSPRAAVIFNPDPVNTLRLSAGSGFRNPTLIENHMNFADTFPLAGFPPFTQVNLVTRGNTQLREEKINSLELAHRGSYGPIRSSATGFYYKLKDVIEAGSAVITSMVPPTLGEEVSFENAGVVEARGGELALEAVLSPSLNVTVNYSYQTWRDTSNSGLNTRNSPQNKGNLGIHYREGGWTSGLWVHAVDRTRWEVFGTSLKLPGYVLVNVHLGYEFSRRWKGLELALDGFNIGGRGHYEIAPGGAQGLPGLNGERIGDRVTLSAVYRTR